MTPKDEEIKNILIQESYVTEEDLAEAEEYIRSYNTSLTDYLLSEEILNKTMLGQAMAEHYNVPHLDLEKEEVDEEVFYLIPETVARDKQVIAFNRNDGVVQIGMHNPEDIATKYLVEKRIGEEVQIFYITENDLNEALRLYRTEIKEEFQEIQKKLQDKGVAKEEYDKNIVRMVDLILEYGQQNKASDIHIEPYFNKALIRLRIDGVLHDVLEIPKELFGFVLSRIKVMAKLRTDEHLKAQDGKLRFQVEGEKIDARVSIVPVPEGENIVIRLLSSRGRRLTLTDLGLADSDLDKVKKGIKSPHGMVLVTGPTGSGKTTTLYAVMKLLNRREVHISTIEDPIEYSIQGITQIQVNTKTGLTFAKGLRSIVRQDPDIIMVGEIRDEETADIAVNSALTGHLVLSTLHTNNAPDTLSRLLDMGIESFLISSTVNIVIAQRLVRKLCVNCRYSQKVKKEDLDLIKNDPKIKKIFQEKGNKDLEKLRFYKSKGCKVCSHTGYSGRVGVFEVLEMSEKVKKLILEGASSDQIAEAARKEGMKTMFQDGVDKVLNGVTTLEEVIRVSKS
ncbi:MAG TPA: ATPase, T2SS/T4P/T4SS family [Patescibacteria group bacterium]|nr:ATPase, T2SS/T4P/T4SS family [Patescibacteria group bacterium]